MSTTTHKITHTIQVAQHVHSGCYLINGQWLIDPTDEQILTGGESNYRDYVDIVDEDDDNYDEDDCEQEHDEDYTIVDHEIELEYTDEDYEEFLADKERFEDNRNSYYGWCMNGGGGKREFSKMYGDGNYMSFAEWLLAPCVKNG